jgi:hypothetical protein
MQNISAYVSAFPTDRYAMSYVLTRHGSERTRFGKFDENMQSAGGIVTLLMETGRVVALKMAGATYSRVP